MTATMSDTMPHVTTGGVSGKSHEQFTDAPVAPAGALACMVPTIFLCRPPGRVAAGAAPTAPSSLTRSDVTSPCLR